MAYTFQDYTHNNVYSISACPSVGDVKILVIPIWLTDSSTYISETGKNNVLSDIDNVFFGSESTTGWHSLSSYFYEESGGLLNIQGTTTDWYECSYSTSEIGATQTGQSLTNQLVVEATNWYFNEYDTSANRQDFDYDGDGYLDGVCLIYGAPDYSALNNYNYANLWAYTYWIQNQYDQTPDTSNPAVNAFFWGSYDFIYGTNATTRTGHSYSNGDVRNMDTTNPVDGHTIIHEFGHVLGLSDYYDYGQNCIPAGGFSMQDYNVGGHDPYSVMALGWSDPYIPTDSCTIEIGAFQSTKDLILLTPDWNDYDSPFDEYLLIELYTPTSLNELDTNYSYKYYYPRGVNTTGIRLWHVDTRLTTCTGVQGSSPIFSEDLTSNPEIDETTIDYGKYFAMSNSYSGTGYVSPLGSDYYNYNQLQLISNTTSTTYRRTSQFGTSDLFLTGDNFKMVNQSRQFVNSMRLNNGLSLGWSFSVAINGSGEDATATIELTRS